MTTVFFTVLKAFDALPLKLSAGEEAHAHLGIVKEQAAKAPVLFIKNALPHASIFPYFTLDDEGLLLVGREILEGEENGVFEADAVL